jgi:glucose/arabinose dehydrogenase
MSSCLRVFLSSCLRISLALLIFGCALIVLLPPIGTAAPAAIPIEPLPPGVVIETVVPNANQLVAMDFTPDGRLLYTERTGNLQVVVKGQSPVTARTFPVLTDGERGLLGVAVDPNFAANHFVWLYFTRYSTAGDCGGTVKNRVVRITLNDDNTVPLDPETAGCFPVYQPAPGYYVSIHNGGNLHFGPDGKLYIGVGNGNEEITDPNEPAQNLSSPLGKMHRYDPTIPLSAPADNPFFSWPGADRSNYAYGLRNPFDFTFDPVSGQLFATDNGDKCDDEINLIRAGYNYGWRLNYPQTPLPCDDDVGPDPRYNTIPPLYHWSSSVAPTGITFYTGDLIPEWKDDLFMCAFKDSSTAIHHFKLNAARTAIVSHTILSDTINHQLIRCRTDLLTGPDGALYFSEGGGYAAYNGPIKRLSRTSSFVASTVMPRPTAPRAGDLLTHEISVQHLGTLSNTFALTVTLPIETQLVAVGSGMTFDADHVYWRGSASGIQSIGSTFTVRVTDTITIPYWLTTPIELTAPNLPPVMLTSTVIVNGYPIFLPLIRR